MGTQEKNNKAERMWKRFRKNRLAFASLFVLALLFLAAIFAPFLADNKPYMLYALFPERVEKKFSFLVSHGREILEKEGRGVMSEEERERELAAFSKQAKLLENFLMEPTVSRLSQRAQGFVKSLDEPNGASGEATGEFIALERLQEAAQEDLKPILCFPLFAGLKALDIILASLSSLLVLSLLWRKIRKTRVNQGIWNGKTIWGLRIGIVLVPAAMGVLLGNQGPDRENYRTGIEDKGIIVQEHPVFPSVLFPPVAYSFDENQPSACSKEPMAGHILGTDDTGRDVLARLLWGGRVSLSVGLASTFLLFILGVMLGSLAGYFKGKVDFFISRFIEVVLCFPSLFLILAIVAFLGPSLVNIMLVMGLTRWTGVARLIRGEFLRIGSMDFVTGAKALGVPSYSIIFRHVLPNAIGPALVLSSFLMASGILIESALSFLGLGTVEPAASWGGLIAVIRDEVPITSWWIVLFPGIAIFLTVTSYNLVGEAMRDLLDPRGTS